MSETRPKRRVEFIEAYWTGGELGSDFHWCDNHGELIRCRDCKNYEAPDEESPSKCLLMHKWMPMSPDWYCADGEPKEQETKQVGLYGKEDWLGLVRVCPDCEAEWMGDESETHFCPNCGRPVKRDD